MTFFSHVSYLLTAFVFIWASVNASEVDDCGSSAVIIEANILDCEFQPCNVTREMNITVDMRFIPVEDIYELRPEVFGVLSDVIEVPFEEFQDQNACDTLEGANCPVAAGTEVVYYGWILLPNDFPVIKGHVKWRLLDQNNATVTCLQVAAEVL